MTAATDNNPQSGGGLLISLIIIGILLLYPAIFPEVRAQQAIMQGTKAGAYSGASIEQLESRKTTIESMTDIDATVKTDAINYIEQAIAFVEIYESIVNFEKEYVYRKLHEVSFDHRNTATSLHSISESHLTC